MRTIDYIYISIFLYLATSVESVSNKGIRKLWSPAFQISSTYQIPWGIDGAAAIWVGDNTLSTTHQFSYSTCNDILVPPGSSTLISVLDLHLPGGEFNPSKPFCQNVSTGASKVLQCLFYTDCTDSSYQYSLLTVVPPVHNVY